MATTDVCRDLNRLQPRVKTLCERLVAECTKEGIRLLVTETYRSPERQAALYAQGRTTPGAIVTSVKTLGAHSFSVAFDIVPLTTSGAADWNNTAAFKRAGAIGQLLGLEWGGAWKSPVDMPHFQYLGGVSLAEYRTGKRPAWWNKAFEGDDDMTLTQEQFNKLMDGYRKEHAQLPADGWASTSWSKGKEKGICDGTNPQGFLLREEAIAMFDRLGLIK